MPADIANTGNDRNPAGVPRPEVRQAVKDLLTRSEAFGRLPPERQQQVARNTALIADYLAAPEGIPGNTLGPSAPGARALADVYRLPTAGGQAPDHASYEEARQAVSEIGDEKFKAGAAREGAEVAGLLMQKVNFPEFVAGLIKGVFHAIVQSSIEQMDAYANMVGQVAKSLQQFRDENVTENQGRDHMVARFPDLFEIGEGGGDFFGGSSGPRLRLRDGVDESDALRRVNGSLDFQDGALKSMDLSDENVEKALVIAARTQLARQRQQLLASLVLMGINRIVVTDGRIHAKILYDFQARDNRSLRRSAAAYDFARDRWGNLAKTRQSEGEYESGGDSSYSRDDKSVDRDANWYAKGNYKYSEQPVMSAMSTASEASDAVLSTRAQLAGTVEVNFKSDYLPLDKMATPGMIAAIQGNSQPVDPNVVPSARNPQAPAGPAQPAQTPAASPAAG